MLLITDEIDAKTAYEIASKVNSERDRLKKLIAPIMDEIKKAAKNGRFNLDYKFRSDDFEIREGLINLGYYIQDQIDDDSDYISSTIYWNR